MIKLMQKDKKHQNSDKHYTYFWPYLFLGFININLWDHKKTRIEVRKRYTNKNKPWIMKKKLKLPENYRGCKNLM